MLPNYSGQSQHSYVSDYRGNRDNDWVRKQYVRARARARQPAAPQPSYDIPQSPGYQGPVQTPSYDNNHPFFDSGSNYAQTGSPYSQLRSGPGSSAMNLWAGENPQAYYYSALNERGLGGLDARSQAAQGMYKDVALGYQAAHTRNMELQLPEYLQGWDPNSVLDQMSEEQLGINRSQFQGRDRWGMRGGM